MAEFLARLPLTFGRPWWLILLPLLLAPMLWMGRHSLAGLGGVRRVLAMLARAAVVTALVMALADARLVQRSDTMTTLFLLDVSESLPNEWQAPMFDFVNQGIRRWKRPNDLAGIIAFGRDARVEMPPVDHPPTYVRVENRIVGEQTDIADAIKLALATFPKETARRIVLVSDGNENRGRALEQALAAAGLHIQIDVVPVNYRYDNEVLVEKIAVPPDVKEGDTVELNVVLRAAAPAKGALQIYQRTNERTAPVTAQPVPIELDRGINVRTIKQTINEPNFYRFAAEFLPERDSGDRRRINNSADGFVFARGTAHVLLIEGTQGEHDELAQALRSRKMQVTTKTAPSIGPAGVEVGDPLPDDLSELQPYDAVILADVPKDAFTEAQIGMLETNCHDLGAGLIMIGGSRSFGAGRWNRTAVEKALPVDCEIKDQKIVGKSALVMVMHASEIPEGNYWQKVVAQEAIKTLSPYDQAGMLHWQGQESWLFTLQNIGDGQTRMLRAIDRMAPGDMPDSGPSLVMGTQALRRSDALTKHFIVISDGDPAAPGANIIKQLIANKITVTCVLVAAHGGDLIGPGWMQSLAKETNGRFYNVQNPKALPRIYQKEARLISRPLIFERPQPWNVTVNPAGAGSELIAGFSADVLPPITGLVLTTKKENSLVDMPLMSPLPGGQINPLLAAWTYGLGRSVAFTSDAGRKWTTAWPTWESYAAFWWQVVRWSLRPVDDRNLTLAMRREDGKVKIVVDALDKDDKFVNFLEFKGIAVTPELDADGNAKTVPVTMVQTAPGRYEGEIDHAEARGNYFLSLGYVGPDGKTGLIRGGVAVPYSDEYRELKSNAAALEAIADSTGGSVVRWQTRNDGLTVDVERTVAGLDLFRRDKSLPPPEAVRPLWPLLLFWASFLFLSDVAVRRLAPDVERWRRAIAQAIERLRGREVAHVEERIEKLKSRKAEVQEQLARARAAVQFEAPKPADGGEAPTSASVFAESQARKPDAPPKAKPKPPTQSAPPTAAQGESYAERLLKAKQKVWDERKKEEDDKKKGG